MQQLIIKISNDSKARSLINFLKHLDFIKIEKVNKEEKVLEFQNEISESLKDLKAHKTSSWKNKKLTLKNA